MKRCPFCAEEIQDAAIVCKHCRRDLAPTATTTLPSPAAQTEHATTVTPAGRTMKLVAAFLGLVLLAWCASLMNPDSSSSTSTPGKGTLDVTVRWGDSAIEITNRGSGAAVGEPLIVYINGTPPFTYKATSTVPQLGENVRLPLNTFTKKDGTRFNPFSTAVTVAWVGGGGYDYSSFGK